MQKPFTYLAAALFLFSSTLWSADQVNFCIEDKDLLPYIKPEGPGGQKPSGILIELVEKAAKATGHEAVFTPLPWKRCIKLVGMGQMDGLLAAIWQQSREQWGVFPKQDGKVDQTRYLWQVVYPIFVSHNSAVQWNGNQFENATGKISAPLGYVAVDKLTALGAFANRAYPAEEGLDMVSKGLLGGYVVEQVIGNRHVEKLEKPGQVKVLPVPFMSAYVHAPLSHQFVGKNPDFKEKFWNALRDIRQKKEVDLGLK